MHDKHLDSGYLDRSRRETFRLARENALQACGSETIAGVALSPPAGPLDRTACEKGHLPAPLALVGEGGVFPLRIGVNTIGPMEGNDVVLSEMHVSRRHCVLVVHAGGRCELHDLASMNGTFVNGKAVTGPVVLSSGDEIRLGHNQRLVFVARPDAQNAQDTSS